jgi:hypothetical protein
MRTALGTKAAVMSIKNKPQREEETRTKMDK